MGAVDQQYFIDLGERIRFLRTHRGITQVQLSKLLGFSQQQVLSFEKGRRRIPVSLIPRLSEILGVSCEELLGVTGKKRKRGPSSRLQTQFERLAQLPKGRQKMVSEVIEALLAQSV